MIKMIDARINRALGKIRQAFRGVFAGVNSVPAVQLAQLEGLSNEGLPDVELMQDYGYTSNPPDGTMAVILPIGGKTAHGIVVATEHGQYRIKGLARGEVAIYTDEGDSIILNRGRVINMTTGTLNINASVAINMTAPEINQTASTHVAMTTPLVTASGNAVIDGDVTDSNATTPKTMRGMRDTYDGHNHDENNVFGGPTNNPNQVM